MNVLKVHKGPNHGTTQSPILLFLVGPKGSGKTSVLKHMVASSVSGTCHFCPSETYFLLAKKRESKEAAMTTADIYNAKGVSWVNSAYSMIAHNIEKAIAMGHRWILCESTGTPTQFAPFIQSMRDRWGCENVFLVHLSADASVCMDRIALRIHSMRLTQPRTATTTKVDAPLILRRDDFLRLLDATTSSVEEISNILQSLLGLGKGD